MYVYIFQINDVCIWIYIYISVQWIQTLNDKLSSYFVLSFKRFRCYGFLCYALLRVSFFTIYICNFLLRGIGKREIWSHMYITTSILCLFIWLLTALMYLSTNKKKPYLQLFGRRIFTIPDNIPRKYCCLIPYTDYYTSH